MGIFIDTYQFATNGQNSSNTYTMSVNGVTVMVEIVDIPSILKPTGGYIGSGLAPRVRKKERKEWEENDEEIVEVEFEEITRKRITVVTTINGEKIVKSKIVKNKPELTIGDINIIISEKDIKPKITIKVN